MYLNWTYGIWCNYILGFIWSLNMCGALCGSPRADADADNRWKEERLCEIEWMKTFQIWK